MEVFSLNKNNQNIQKIVQLTQQQQQGIMKSDQQLLLLKEIFEENNQVLDKASYTASNNQFQALSTALFNTSQYCSEIQEQCVKTLLTLVERNQLTKKLSIFNNNITLIKDYQFNQAFTGFQNINFELVSIAYETKIVVYTITEKHSLYASIFNHKYQKTIYVFKEGLHYDVVYKQKYYEIKNFCNDLLTNLLNKHFPIDIVDTPFLTLDAEGSDKLEQATSQKFSPKHKKSRSQDYSQFQERSLKSSSSVKKFCEFKMVDDDSNKPISKQSMEKIDYFTDTLGIQNYNVTNSKLSSPNNWTPFIDQFDENENQNKNEDFSLVVQQINGVVMNHSVSDNSDNSNENLDQNNESNNNQQQENQKQDSSSSQGKQNYQINAINESEFMTPPPPALQADGTFKQDVQFYLAEPQKQNGNFNKEQQQQSQVQEQSLLNQFPPFYNYYPMVYQQIPQFPINQMGIPSTKTQVRADENSVRFSGRLKFFDENKNYGFLVKDDDQVDIFVHYDDLALAGMTKEFLKTSRLGNMIRFSFSCLNYVGKYDKSIKAVDLEFVPN